MRAQGFVLFCAATAAFGSCNQPSPGVSAALGAGNGLISAVAASGPANAPIDLTVPQSEEPQTDAGVFDESVVFAPNFAINQNDPALSDLFDKNGDSSLCFPTSLAEDLTYLFGYHQPKFSALPLAGLSNGSETIDPNALIRQLAALCKTDPANGTDSLDALHCMLTLVSEGHYGVGGTQLISPFNQDPTLPILTREVTVQDIRAAVKAGTPAILEVAWFTFDATTKQWTRSNGHYIGIYGYDYDNSWGENEIQVKVVNPDINYGPSRQAAIWDTLTIERYSPQPGVTYPPSRPFIVSGHGFSGLTKRGFVGMMLTIAPEI